MVVFGTIRSVFVMRTTGKLLSPDEAATAPTVCRSHTGRNKERGSGRQQRGGIRGRHQIKQQKTILVEGFSTESKMPTQHLAGLDWQRKSCVRPCIVLSSELCSDDA